MILILSSTSTSQEDVCSKQNANKNKRSNNRQMRLNPDLYTTAIAHLILVELIFGEFLRRMNGVSTWRRFLRIFFGYVILDLEWWAV